MWNIIIGGVFVVGVLSGKLALIGTDSSMGITIVGGGLIVWGIVQLVRGQQEE
jgi:hypothetical protein